MDLYVCREAHSKSKLCRFYFSLGPFASYQNLLLIGMYMFVASVLARSVYLAWAIIQGYVCPNHDCSLEFIELLVLLTHLPPRLSVPLTSLLGMSFSNAHLSKPH